jgi:hypothetical protein
MKDKKMATATAAQSAASAVPAEKVDTAAFTIMKAGRQLESGKVTTSEFIVFIVETLRDIGAVSLRKKVLVVESPTSTESPSPQPASSV